MSTGVEDIRVALDSVKAWLIARPDLNLEDPAVIKAPDGLRSIGFADLKLDKIGPHHQDGIINAQDSSSLKPKSWTELWHLVSWTNEFLEILKKNKLNLAALGLLQGLNEYPISLAKFHVEEAITVIDRALNFDSGLSIQHPDTRAQNYAVNNILVEDSTCIYQIIRSVFTRLFTKCAVRLVVKTTDFYSSALTAYLVDLMYQSGATDSEICCMAFDRRESIGSERFSKCISSNRASKLSVIAAVFKKTDTFAASRGIIESYFREQYQNLIVLVEESAYDAFVIDWQRYYSHAVHIGPRLDNRTTVVDAFNSKVQIDLTAIDVKASHKMAGNVINVLKFRSTSELQSLINTLRKVPYMTVWNDDVLLSRDFCLKVNLCSEFWINHIPKGVAGRKFSDDILSYYLDTVSEDMTYIYNSVHPQYTEELEQLKKMQATFIKKDSILRSKLIYQAFISLVSKSKSLKNGQTIGDSISRLKHTHNNAHKVNSDDPTSLRVETILEPVGLAILMVREDTAVKSKAVLVEFIFKNLLLGNAVLLVCPVNTLGVKFSFDNDHIIPFKMVHESLPDFSKLSLSSAGDDNETMVSKKTCPKNTYAIEILPELTAEMYESIIYALGTRRRNLVYPDVDGSNYWSNE